MMSTSNIEKMESMDNSHVNFMGGKSFEPNPLISLKLVVTSFFLGESKQYYREIDDSKNDKSYDKTCLTEYHKQLDGIVLNKSEWCNKSSLTIFYDVCQKALDYDFEGVLNLAKTTRNDFLMRKTPQMILAFAAAHPMREDFNKKNPTLFRKIILECCPLPGDMINILEAWKNLKGSKSGFPSFIKRAFADRISVLTPYQANKYRKPCIDATRISHPSNPKPLIQELMENGDVEVDECDLKWETLRSQGKSWLETLDILKWKMPHMAALRNIIGFARNVRNTEHIKRYCDMVVDGVKGGKQFPYRYLTAYQQISKNSKTEQKTKKVFRDVKSGQSKKWFNKPLRKEDEKTIADCLERCLQRSIENFPKLKGNVCCLSDNSGSAHGTITSTYGENTVADIGNLSALFTAYSCTGRGMIGLFGDKLLEYEVDKSKSLLQQYDEIQTLAGPRGQNVGGSTENGIWLFFKRAMAEPTKYRFDYWFAYSDMQAGHGGLYGNDPEMADEWLWSDTSTKYIHIPKLLENYRKKINPKLNCFTVQTAGYDNSILPEATYRGAILAGWTGNEAVYADRIAKLWDEIEKIQS
jgi:hypothetical protein